MLRKYDKADSRTTLPAPAGAPTNARARAPNPWVYTRVGKLESCKLYPRYARAASCAHQ